MKSRRTRSTARERKDHWHTCLRGQLQVYEIAPPDLVEEHVFLPGRRFRFDFAIPRLKIGMEVEGGVFAGDRAGQLDVVGGKLVSRPGGKSRHTTGAGYTRDAEKYNLAALAGWLVLRFTSPMLVTGQAVQMVREAIRRREDAVSDAITLYRAPDAEKGGQE